MSKTKSPIVFLTLLLIALAGVPGVAAANDSSVSTTGVSSAQQALKDLKRLEATDSYKNLQAYVRQLAAKRRASNSQKKSYYRQLGALRSEAGKEVAARNKVRKEAARESNRRGLQKALNRAFRPYKLKIQQITLESRGDIIAVKNQFRSEAREVRAEWAPRVNRAKRQAQKKIAKAKRYIAGSALKKYKKKARRVVRATIAKRAAYIDTEIWPMYENEIKQIEVQRRIDVQEVRNEFNTEVRPAVNSRWDNKFKKEELPRLQKIVDRETGKLNDLSNRGKKIIAAL